MFRGINSISLDPKGRIILPVNYRAQLQDASQGGRMVITVDTEDRCLLLYSFIAWEEIEKKIEALPSFNQLTRRIQRLLIGHATELEVDSSGRILIPPLLRGHARLEKRVMLVGQGKKIEIWDEETWNNASAVWFSEGLGKVADGLTPPELQELSL